MTNHEKMSEQLDRIMESVVFEPRMEQAVRQCCTSAVRPAV